LRRLAAMGAALSEKTLAAAADVLPAATIRPLHDTLRAAATPLEHSSLFASVPSEHQIIEGVAWDPSERRLYATSVAGQRLLRLSRDGSSATVAAANGVAGLFGAFHDPVRDQIWVASSPIVLAATPHTGFRGVVSFQRGTLVRMIPPKEGTEPVLGDVTVARDGTVYASDGMTGAVYQCRPGCGRLETLLAPGTLFSAQGMAVSPDQRWLYVADYRYGIAVLERTTGRLRQLQTAAPMMLDGIDGLLSCGRDLIAVQNGILPARIIRLSMSRSGERVERLTVLERAHREWREPGLATLAGRALLYVADTQWDRFEGAVPLAPRATPIRRLPLECS